VDDGISQTSSLDNEIYLQGQLTINQLENIMHKQMANLVKQESQVHQQYHQHPLDNLHHPNIKSYSYAQHTYPEVVVDQFHLKAIGNISFPLAKF
jgi:hypothetical protein